MEKGEEDVDMGGGGKKDGKGGVGRKTREGGRNSAER